MAASLIQRLHDGEISGGLVWPVEGLILVYLGRPKQGRHPVEVLVQTYAEAEEILHRAALQRYPASRYAQQQPQAPSPPPDALVQRLYEAGINGAVCWEYPRWFGVRLLETDLARADEPPPFAAWSELERWMTCEVERRFPRRADATRGHRPDARPSGPW